MKLVFVSLFLFVILLSLISIDPGAVIAETSQDKWISETIQNLNLRIPHLKSIENRFSEKCLSYFADPVNKIITKTIRVRDELLSFPVQNSNSIQDELFKRLKNDYDSFDKELHAFREMVDRENIKHMILFNCAYELNLHKTGLHSYLYNFTSPNNLKLIDDVKAIISKENAIEKADESDMKSQMMAELSEQYETLKKASEYSGGMNSWVDETVYYYEAVRKAESDISNLTNKDSFKYKDRVELIKYALGCVKSSTIEKFQLVPLDSAEKVDQFLVRGWNNYRSIKNLKRVLRDSSMTMEKLKHVQENDVDEDGFPARFEIAFNDHEDEIF